MSNLLPEIEDLRIELKAKAPTYFTEDRLSFLTYNDAAMALAEINSLLAQGIKEPFAPNEDGRTIVTRKKA